MSEENIEANAEVPPQKNIEINTELAPERTKRLRWIDAARGFVMVYLVWTLALPGEITSGIPFLAFLFDHPGDTAHVMNLFDIGTPAFLFIVGLSLSIAFWRYADKKGTWNALLRVMLRFGFLFIVGYILELGQNSWQFSVLLKEKIDVDYGPINVIWWDVIIAIGFCGLTTLPFIFIKNPWMRTGIAYAWMIIYQVLLLTIPYFRVYAVQSIHGGIYASIFTLTSVTVIGTALGDYMFSNKDPKKKQYTTLGIFGGANVVLGIGLGFIPEMYWNKEMATLTFGMVSIGIITLGCLLFILMDEKLNWELKYFIMFGMNPLLAYMVAEVIYQLPDMLFTITQLGTKMLIWENIILLVSLICWLLYRKKKRVRTEWVTLAFLILIVALSFVI